ncbi:MAG: hypothetical protein FJX47_13310 [Alphaproteobacteria bacterium]|nr:hypothetical protein [Alphaproteobacteria bacterium]
MTDTAPPGLAEKVERELARQFHIVAPRSRWQQFLVLALIYASVFQTTPTWRILAHFLFVSAMVGGYVLFDRYFARIGADRIDIADWKRRMSLLSAWAGLAVGGLVPALGPYAQGGAGIVLAMGVLWSIAGSAALRTHYAKSHLAFIAGVVPPVFGYLALSGIDQAALIAALGVVLIAFSVYTSTRLHELVRQTTESVLRNQELALRLKAAADEARAASAAKSRYLATMNHQLRTPLSGILATFQFLDNEALTPPARRLLQIAQSSSNDMLALINETLDMSRIEAGHLALIEARFDPRETITLAADAFRAAATAKGLELAIDLPASVPAAVLGDAFRLRQIVGNLVNNAVKFTKRGRIAVEASAEVEGPPWFFASRCATPASASPPRFRRGSSGPSSRPTPRPPRPMADPASASPSCGSSRASWAATSASKASSVAVRSFAASCA